MICGSYCEPGECRCRPCMACGEATLNAKLCRDCDLDKLFAEVSKCPCGHMLWGSIPLQMNTQPHADTCPHADEGTYGIQPEEEPSPEALQAAYAAGYRAGRADALTGSASDG